MPQNIKDTKWDEGLSPEHELVVTTEGQCLLLSLTLSHMSLKLVGKTQKFFLHKFHNKKNPKSSIYFLTSGTESGPEGRGEGGRGTCG